MKLLLSIFYLLLFQFSNSQNLLKLYIPEHSTSDSILYYNNFIVGFNVNKCLPEFSIYLLTKERTKGKIKRTNNFHSDSKIKCVTSSQYIGTGYDKGHLTPAEDMSFDESSMSDCFVMTNIAPQVPNLNRGIWKKLENKVRKEFVQKHDSLIIISGVISDSLNQIKELNVPKMFFKIIYSIKDDEYIGYVFNNNYYEKNYSLNNLIVSKKIIENLTKLKFKYNKYDPYYWK
ncbi:MAG: DNA/RNA non-specific endonuclease [Bacteroidota bacterium]|nr:DNA/RNA non-specific endonuclease [Bacteroidota bacterium]